MSGAASWLGCSVGVAAGSSVTGARGGLVFGSGAAGSFAFAFASSAAPCSCLPSAPKGSSVSGSKFTGPPPAPPSAIHAGGSSGRGGSSTSITVGVTWVSPCCGEARGDGVSRCRSSPQYSGIGGTWELCTVAAFEKSEARRFPVLRAFAAFCGRFAGFCHFFAGRFGRGLFGENVITSIQTPKPASKAFVALQLTLSHRLQTEVVHHRTWPRYLMRPG